MEQRYQTFIQAYGLPQDFGFENADSESESSDDCTAENLNEWAKISKRIINSSDESGDENFSVNSSAINVDSGSRFKCGICGKSFLYKRNLCKHRKEKHPETKCNPTQALTNVPNLKIGNIKCNFANCHKRFVTRSGLQKHLKLHNGTNSFSIQVSNNRNNHSNFRPGSRVCLHNLLNALHFKFAAEISHGRSQR
jgi:hypothetical protein